MKIQQIIGVGVLAAVAFVGGQAFTAGNDLPSASVTKGYGSQTITGVTATAVTYDTNTAGDTVTAVGLVLTGDTTAQDIKIAFNDAAPETCSDAGVFATGATAYSCVTNQAVDTATKFALVAS